MRTNHSARRMHIARTAKHARGVTAVWALTLLLGAFVGAPLAAADSALSQADLDQWIAEGGYYSGAYEGAVPLSLTTAPQVDQAGIDRWAAQAGYYAGAYQGASPLLLAAAPQTGQSDVDRWAAQGGYYQGAYSGASPGPAGFATLGGQADLSCWATEAAYYILAVQSC